MNRFIGIFSPALLVLAALIAWNCGGSSSSRRSRGEGVPTLASTIQIAAFDYSGLKGRLDKKTVTALARTLKKEQIEVLVVHNIKRYPGLRTRTDFVNELAAQADMRQAFGETVASSGTQSGNAVFSLYPILSSFNHPYEKIPGISFAGALQTTVDGGSGSVVVVSTAIPEKVTRDAQTQCMKEVSGFVDEESPLPLVVVGNLPDGDAIRSAGEFVDAGALLKDKRSGGADMWYLSDDMFKPLSARTISTGFGPMLVVKFGIMRLAAIPKEPPPEEPAK